MIRNLLSIWIMFFHVFFCNIIKVNHFVLFYYIVTFSLFFYLLDTWLYFLPSFELNAILLISSVKSLSHSLLNLYCVFNFNLLIFMSSLWSFLRISTSILFFSRWFILFSRWVASKLFLWSSNSIFFLWHTFFCLLDKIS